MRNALEIIAGRHEIGGIGVLSLLQMDECLGATTAEPPIPVTDS